MNKFDYRSVPSWLAAQDRFIDPGPGYSGDRFIRSLEAALDMYYLERAGGAA